jgi:hypothetical protein
MPLVSSSIANLVNGVSQQPYTLRLASQAEVQENGLSTVAQGLKKRPPTKHIKRISAAITGGAYVHTINRDTTEQYVVVITNGDLKVYDLAGNAKTVNFPNGTAYLSDADPASAFRALTVADYTFILNRNKVVADSGSTSATRPYEALVVVKNGLYGKTYKVFINGSQVAAYTTPDGSTASMIPQIATDYIATQLRTQITAAGVSGLTVGGSGSVIYLTKTADFTISTSDGYGDAALFTVKNQMQRFSDLPANAGVQNFTVEIVGDKTSAFDDYWVKFDIPNGGTGVWREAIKPGISTGFSASTMPWGLIRESDGTFTCKPLTWNTRTVGDDKSAPHPSFVGRTIQDVFFYRNRLGFLADESVCFSEAGEFFNFYPTTVTDLLDSDPIDVAVSHTKVSNLIAAVPFSKQLLLFSQQTQFSVEAGDLLTPKTIAIQPTTEFECDPNVHPEGIGKVVFFAVPKGGFSGVREYYVDNDTGNNDAAEVTSHVPKYLPQNLSKIAVASNEDTLVALSPDTPNVLWVYRFYWNNNEKLQSSWSKWVFAQTDTILNMDFLESTLSLLIQRADGLYLEELDISAVPETGTPDYDPTYLVHLDRRVTLPPTALTYSSPYTIINTTALGYTPTDGDYAIVGAAGSGTRQGVLGNVEVVGGVCRALGDFTGQYVIVGRKYLFRYRFSTIVPKRRSANGGEVSDNVARLQLRKMQVNHAETGYFQALVTPQGRPTYTYTYTGKNLGLGSSTIGLDGLANFEDGGFSFPIMSQNTSVTIELQSDSPLPCSFLSADWEGFYAKRSQGI